MPSQVNAAQILLISTPTTWQIFKSIPDQIELHLQVNKQNLLRVQEVFSINRVMVLV